jgi:hypothetical protein
MRMVVPAVIGVVLAIAAWKFVDAMRVFDARADANGATPRIERVLAGAHAVDIDRQFLRAAKRLLPPNARYVVETGPNAGQGSLTLSTLPSYSLWWLLPRRQVSSTEGTAEYLLCYGCELPAGLQTLWTNGHGLVIARSAA